MRILSNFLSRRNQLFIHCSYFSFSEMPLPKRIRSSSPTSTHEQCPPPSTISRYMSHDSYLTFVSPSSSDQSVTASNNSNIEIDFIDDALWDDWDLPSTTNKKTPGKIRTMSSPALHSRSNHITAMTTHIVDNAQSK